MLGETPRVVGLDGRLHRTTRVIETGTKPVYRLRTRGGYEVKLTADHRVWTENRGDVRAAELTKDDLVRLAQPRFGKETLEANVAEYAGLMLGAGQVMDGVAQLTMLQPGDLLVAEKAAHVVNGFERQDEMGRPGHRKRGRPRRGDGSRLGARDAGRVRDAERRRRGQATHGTAPSG